MTERPAKKRRRDDFSASSCEDTSRDSSEGNTSDERSKKRKKTKERKHKEKTKKHKFEKKKHKKKKHKVSLGAIDQSNYGKYGLLAETDIVNKQSEFFMWLLEVKQIDPEVQPRFELKKLFDDYREDYNTATLPHKKYYDLETYEAMRRQKGKKRKVKEKVVVNDEQEHRKQLKAAHRTTSTLTDLSEMKQVMRERAEEEYKKKAGLKADETRGVRYHIIPQ